MWGLEIYKAQSETFQRVNSPLHMFDRTDLGLEDGDGEEGGTTVFHEDVHGLTALIHLPHEVRDHDDSVHSVSEGIF